MRADVFVGRKTELADVSTLLERVRHVTLTGPAAPGRPVSRCASPEPWNTSSRETSTSSNWPTPPRTWTP
ncbi:hypothetical protein ACFQX6_35460 [Streptosporangium lutulentum]